MSDFLLISFVFLTAGVLAASITARRGFGSVIGYLIAGVLISPVLLTLGVDPVSIQHITEFGVVLLLFIIGLDINPKMIWAMRYKLLGMGGGQLGLTTIALMSVGVLLGIPWSMALAISFILSLSSTAIVLQSLAEKSLLRSEGGQSSSLLLLVQNVAVFPLLAVLPLLALPELVSDFPSSGHVENHGQSNKLTLIGGLAGWQTTMVTIVSVALVVIGGRYLTGPVFRYIAASRVHELFTMMALLLIIAISLLMLFVGLSPALGTLLAGVVLANSEYRHELKAVIDPFRGLLLAVFFMTVGASINFELLTSNFVVLVSLTLGLLVIKAIILLTLARVFKLEGTDRWLFGLGLAQSGESGFVLLSFAVANGVMPYEIADQLLLIIALSMLSTPLLFYFIRRLSGKDTLGAAAWAGELTVFISYSHYDSEHMQAITSALQDRGFNVTVDTRDLPFGEQWQAELSHLIERSDIVLWLASRNAIRSKWCNWELSEVARFRKKLIPVAIGEVLPEEIPLYVSKIQLLPAQGLFRASRRDHISALVQVLGNDASWVKTYSRLSDRAQAWDQASRSEDRLLSPAELTDAEIWQAEQPPLAPEPIPLLLDYIHSSRTKINQSSVLQKANELASTRENQPDSQ